MKKTKNPKKTKLIWLQIFSFIVTIAPLIITVACNWEHYTKTTGDIVRLSIGGFVVLFILFLKVIGKLKWPERKVVSYGIWFALCILLNSVIQDCILLVGMAWLGEVLDFLFFQTPIKRLREEIHIDKTADATTEKVEEVIKKYIGDK
ncbi:MAG: hypothetical protein IKB98_02495 [Clostridia bacterium]|nr:hypothetical protein [Clostridia bacterium]